MDFKLICQLSERKPLKTPERGYNKILTCATPGINFVSHDSIGNVFHRAINENTYRRGSVFLRFSFAPVYMLVSMFTEFKRCYVPLCRKRELSLIRQQEEDSHVLVLALLHAFPKRSVADTAQAIPHRQAI